MSEETQKKNVVGIRERIEDNKANKLLLMCFPHVVLKNLKPTK